jgi:Membrane-fusion protein
MRTEIPVINQVKTKKKINLKLIVICLAILIIAAAVYAYITISKSKTTGNTVQSTTTVSKGNISVSITGSSYLESSNRRVISPKVTSKITKVNIKEGDQVKAGDVLFELDDTDALLNIENTKNSIAQTELSQKSNLKSVTGLEMKAPFSGQVTDITVKQGDTVGKGSAVLTLTDQSKLKVVLPFSGNGVKEITKGTKAVVSLQDIMQSVEGTVTYVSSKPYSTAAGGELYNIEIEIDNPGSLEEGMQASAEIETSAGTVSSAKTSTLAYKNSTKLKCDAGGTVKNLNVMENQFVNQGDLLMSITNDDLKLTVDTTQLKLDNLQRQLEIQNEQLEYYKITAPNNGTVTALNAQEGDTAKPGDELAAVSDMSHIDFTVSVDELDIAKVQVGQRVDVTVDALTETSAKPLSGKVTKTAMEGTYSNGVTTYPVTITLDQADKLKAGMNANAEIYISEKNDVLRVPLEAIQKMGNRSFVWVKGSSQGMQFGQNGPGNGNNSGNSSNANGNSNNTQGQQGNNQQSSGQQGNNQQSSGQQGSGQQGNSQQSNGQQGYTRQYTGQQGSTSAGTNGRNRSNSKVNSYYANAHMVPVETGINDDSYMEIISGLEEGQVIILPQVTTSSKQNSTTQNNSSGMGFGMGVMGGGGVPGGGNTSGGNGQRSSNYKPD